MPLGGTTGPGGGGAGPGALGWARVGKVRRASRGLQGPRPGRAGAPTSAAWLWGPQSGWGVVPAGPAPPSSQATWPPVSLQSPPFPSLGMRKIGGFPHSPFPSCQAAPLAPGTQPPVCSPSAVYRPPGLGQAPALCAVGPGGAPREGILPLCGLTAPGGFPLAASTRSRAAG